MAGELSIVLSESDYEHIMQQLEGLENIEKQAIIQKALQEGVKIIAQAGRQTLRATESTIPWNVHMRQVMAAKRGGSLYQSIGTKTVKKKLKGYAGFGKFGHHAHLVDTGTVDRYTKAGAFRGKVEGSRFWRTAFETKKDEAVKNLLDSIKRTIEKFGK